MQPAGAVDGEMSHGRAKTVRPDRTSHAATGNMRTAAASTKDANSVLLSWNAPESAARSERDCQRLWNEGNEARPCCELRCRADGRQPQLRVEIYRRQHGLLGQLVPNARPRRGAV